MMSLRFTLAAAAAAFSLAAPALADDAMTSHPDGMIHVHDAYARNSGVGSGAVFFTIHNNTQTDDRLVGARTEVAERAELHTHVEEDGVMKMVAIEGGIALPFGEMHELKRGGDHVMLMGLKQELKDGDSFPLTLVFEHYPEMTFDVVVDNARKPEAAALDGEAAMEGMDHSAHGMAGGGDADAGNGAAQGGGD